MSSEPTVVLEKYSFLEGPRWREGRIWVSDFYTHQVVSARGDGSDVRVEAEVPTQPSGLGWLPDGRLLIVSMRDDRILRREADGTLVEHADLSAHCGGHLNDMYVDDQGRAYAGNFGFDLMGGGTPSTAPLVRADPDGTVTVVAEDLWFPNGMVRIGDVLTVNETMGNRISAFDVAADGSLGPRRDFAVFDALPPARTSAPCCPRRPWDPTARRATPRAPCGSRTRSGSAPRGCSTGRSSTRSTSVPASTRWRSAATTAAPSSCARRPASPSTSGGTRARRGCWP